MPTRFYVPWVQSNDWDTIPYDLGVFSSIERAEEAIIEVLRNFDQEVLTLDIYKSMTEEPEYLFGIHECNLNELGIYHELYSKPMGV